MIRPGTSSSLAARLETVARVGHHASDAVGNPDSVAYLSAAALVQKLLSPAEMGELFKVIALAKSDGIAWPGFALADRSHRL